MSPTASTTTGRPSSVISVAALAALGCGALAARPAMLASVSHPTRSLALLFGALLVIGIAVPLPETRSPTARDIRISATVVLIGGLAFAAGRLIGGGFAPARLSLGVVLANSLAAVAEEVWFRRVCFGLLASAGPLVAGAGAATLFAAVHVAIYGYWVVPLDLAAGALFGWQRAITGTWTVPAATHILANLFVLL